MSSTAAGGAVTVIESLPYPPHRFLHTDHYGGHG